MYQSTRRFLHSPPVCVARSQNGEVDLEPEFFFVGISILLVKFSVLLPLTTR